MSMVLGHRVEAEVIRLRRRKDKLRLSLVDLTKVRRQLFLANGATRQRLIAHPHRKFLFYFLAKPRALSTNTSYVLSLFFRITLTLEKYT